MSDKKEEEKTPEQLAREAAQEELQRKALKDPNINPLLNNGITNRDIFRTLLFHFKTDNYLPIDKAADFVVNLLKRPVETKYDQEAEKRFNDSLKGIMSGYALISKTKIYEDEFCALM